MNCLKTVFAILASFLLVGTQYVFAVGEKSAPASQECRCCACKQTDCCIAQSNSPAQPIPANPVRTVSQNAFQLFAIVSSLLLPLPEIAPQKITSTPSVFLSTIVVPLYERNCTYLI